MGPTSPDSTSVALWEVYQKSHIGQLEELYDMLTRTVEPDIEGIKAKVLHVRSLVFEEVKKREEAEKDVHKAIKACAQLCDGLVPIKNKYGR